MSRTLALVAKTKSPHLLSTLAEVIDFLSEGGGPDNKALTPLHLSAIEKEQLRLFLEEGLTGAKTTFTFPKIP